MNKLYEEALTKRIKSELSKEIHDELGNALAIISSRIKVAKIKLCQNDTIEPDFFDKAEVVADELLKSTKDFIWTVGSSNENPANIFYYLKDIGEELFEMAGIKFFANLSETNSKDEVKLSVKQSYQIVLMFKEAITNVAKHSHATEVHLNMTICDKKMVLLVRDNGVGFDKKIKNIRSQNSFGLRNIAERAGKIGGSVSISSRLEKGTMVKFILDSECFGLYAVQPESFISGQAS